jgi:hypothetical protein
MSEHHDAVLYELRKTVGETIDRAHRIGGPLANDMATRHYGLGLIVCRGFLEREMNKMIELPEPGKFPKRMKNITDKPCIPAIDFWHYKFDADNRWYGWQELANCFRLADCCAGQPVGPRVKAFLKQLQAGEVRDRKKKPIPTYYEIDSAGELKLTSEALSRFTQLTGELVHLVEKFSRRRKKK